MNNLRIKILGRFPYAPEYTNTFNLLKAFEKDDRFTVVSINGDYAATDSLYTTKSSLVNKLQNSIFNLLFSLFSAFKICLSKSNEADLIYVPYPSIFVLFFLSFMPRKLHRNTIIIDAFISIFDTAVNDRRLFGAKSMRGKILFQIEKQAFSCANKVLVDTQENADFYSKLFSLPQNRFLPVPLCIDESILPKKGKAGRNDDHFQVLFFGSFVPLQGVPLVFNVARLLLEKKSKINFTIIGNGQTKRDCGEAPPNVEWHEQWCTTEDLLDYITVSDLCLGVFGETEKAKRIWPYKNYWAMACAKPILTGYRPTIVKDALFFSTDELSPEGVANEILRISKMSESFLKDIGRVACECYQSSLSNRAALDVIYNSFSIADKYRW